LAEITYAPASTFAIVATVVSEEPSAWLPLRKTSRALDGPMGPCEPCAPFDPAGPCGPAGP
jgi:hypothetical protein